MKVEKAKNPQNVLTLNLNEISSGRSESEEQKGALKNIKLLYESREVVIKLMLILQLYLGLNTNQFMKKGSKY